MQNPRTLEEYNALPPRSLTHEHQVVEEQMLWLPAELIGRVAVTAVLLSGGIGDYAVYVGAGTSAWVADHGNKLPFEQAVLLFPGLQRERYRGS